MLRPRISPCLLIRNGGLVKTVQFKTDKYVGDPINAVKIFNEKAVDELIVIDIDATRFGQEPNYALLQRLANESRMPLCYGGGIKECKQAEKIIQMGFEKIALSSAALAKPELLGTIANAIGKQSVVGVLDVKKNMFNNYSIYIDNGTKKVDGKLADWVATFQSSGVGEILINSIDRDGMRTGYDLNLVKNIVNHFSVPSTFLGGASSLSDIGELIALRGVGGCAAGSMFVFKGKYRAVLISYPKFKEKYDLILESMEKYHQSTA
jgi:imidazole glycerol-phosphate synthase subunit HisF